MSEFVFPQARLQILSRGSVEDQKKSGARSSVFRYEFVYFATKTTFIPSAFATLLKVSRVGLPFSPNDL